MQIVDLQQLKETCKIIQKKFDLSEILSYSMGMIDNKKIFSIADQILMNRIRDLEKKNAQLEEMLEGIMYRLEDLDGEEFKGWPLPEDRKPDVFVPISS